MSISQPGLNLSKRGAACRKAEGGEGGKKRETELNAEVTTKGCIEPGRRVKVQKYNGSCMIDTAIIFLE